MDNFTILVKGLFETKNLIISSLEEKKTFPLKINKIINNYWENETKKSLFLFNGVAYSLKNYSTDNNIFFLTLQKTDFKSYFGTNLNPNFTEKQYFANVLGLNILIKTYDNYFILGKRSKYVAEMKNMWHCIGGNLDSVNPVKNAIKELKEEINLDYKYIDSVKILGLLDNHITKRKELLFLIKTSLDKNFIKNTLHTAIDKREHTIIDFFDLHSLRVMLTQKDVTPGTKGLIKVYIDLFEKES